MDKYILPISYGNCIYYYDVENNKVIKICDVTGNEELPKEIADAYSNIGSKLRDVVK
jgi:hypothetical protein